MSVRSAFGLLVLLVVMGVAAPAAAQPPDVQVVSVELVGNGGAAFTVNDRPYAGPMIFTLHDTGIVVTERATIEQYLQGIAEMPFLWNEEALAAQAVAARTYLARRLLGGRRGDAARYGYDICATNVCQVYRGVQLVDGAHGDRWKAAVEVTAGEVVIYDGKPIEAVFTSMVGSRSRANQDVWASSAVPYLQPVDSPEVGIAPYATWEFAVSAGQFVEILKADGLEVSGELESIQVADPPEGQGRTEITVVTSGGTDSILAPHMKSAFNRRGDALYPGALPAVLADGTKLPEPVPSYTYDLTHIRIPPRPADRLLPMADRVSRDEIRFEGEGWGHGVGMSQWGARILADGGSEYGEILAHYYGGLRPELAPALVPEEVMVGLASERAETTVVTSQSVQILINGIPFGQLAAGEWTVRSTPSGLGLIAMGDLPLRHPLGQRHWPR